MYVLFEDAIYGAPALFDIASNSTCKHQVGITLNENLKFECEICISTVEISSLPSGRIALGVADH